MTIGLSMDQELCLVLGQVSLSSLYWKKKPPDGFLWSGGEINEETAYIQARSSMDRTQDKIGKKC